MPARTLFDPPAREALLERLGRLRPDAPARWGRFTAPEMVAHLAAPMRYALGEMEAKPIPGPLARWPLNWLLIHVVPWPKGRARSPGEFLGTASGWAQDVEALKLVMHRFAERGQSADWPPSPVFGRISGGDWGVLMHKHLDHHFRQFGV